MNPPSFLAAAQRAALMTPTTDRNTARWAAAKRGLLVAAVFLLGCTPPQYGTERQLTITDGTHPVWAVAPAINLSGEKSIDPVLQADLVFHKLQEVNNMRVIPVNRVVAVMSALRIEKIESEEQAAIVCQQLGCDALVIPTITAFDAYDPPKLGAALQLLPAHGHGAVPHVDARELVREASPAEDQPLARQAEFIQVVGMYDAADGSTRAAMLAYQKGRHDPVGPMGDRELLLDSDKFCAFVYYTLIEQMLGDRAKPVAMNTAGKPVDNTK